jgi:hypothetical protein
MPLRVYISSQGRGEKVMLGLRGFVQWLLSFGTIVMLAPVVWCMFQNILSWWKWRKNKNKYKIYDI